MGIPTRWVGSARNVRHPSGFLFAGFRIRSAAMTLSPQTEYGASFSFPDFPWLQSLAPQTPQGVSARCSPASQLLWPNLTSLGFSSLVSNLSIFRCGPARQRGGLETSQLDFVQKTLAFRSKRFRLWRFTPKLAQWAKCSLRSPQRLVVALGRTTTLPKFCHMNQWAEAGRSVYLLQ